MQLATSLPSPLVGEGARRADEGFLSTIAAPSSISLREPPSPTRGAGEKERRAVTAKSLMVMGTGSDVGKSLLVTGLCRAYANRGLKVAPFKPQNMSNNAAVTADGGEIGRAQALQARAARRQPVTAMNPVLLKPEHETGSQLVVRGERIGSYKAKDYWSKRHELLPVVLAAHEELAA